MAAPAAQIVPQFVRARDLASVALKAATDLDNLIRHKPSDLEGVRELARQLAAKVVKDAGARPASLVDPTTAIVLGRAVGDTPGGMRPQQVREVAAATEQWIEQMADLVDAAGTADDLSRSLANLRSFCLAVSRHATAMTPTPLERTDHPFRRLRV